MNVQFICSNIPAAPVYEVYISQIRYYRAWGSYRDFLDRGWLLTMKLLNQRFIFISLKSSLRKFWLATMTWLTVKKICVTKDHGYGKLVVTTARLFTHSWLVTGFVTRVRRRVSLVEQEQLRLPEHMSFNDVRVARSLVFFIMFCTLLFVPSYFFFCPLCCLLFFYLRLLIAHLTSSNSSYCRYKKSLNTMKVIVFLFWLF